ncbi:hypothetical protein [Maridesulfovibrio bastinii]|uniref:hypothetical protein n=1 Tax=Maridesulfovibrio bastinii TaxID=47157 RepID=UPI000487BCC3|nr:hypothetical protein [Maridesulfovibrio bastinii]
MSKEEIISQIIRAKEPMTVFFVGAFSTSPYGKCNAARRAPMYRNYGVFTESKGRIQTEGMPFSRHISKVSCILNKSGSVVFGQYCSKCKEAVPQKWGNCPICSGKLKRPVN